MVGRAGRDAVRLARRCDQIPQCVAHRAIGQEQFVSALAAPAGLADHHRNTGELDLAVMEEPKALDEIVTEQVTGHGGRLRTLHGERGDVGLERLDVEPFRAGDRLAVLEQVTVGDREPPAILGEAEHDGVVDEDAVVIADRGIPSSAWRERRQVTSRDAVAECSGVGADDLDLALGSDVPHRDTGFESVVLAEGVAVAGRHVHPVVDREMGCTSGDRRREVRRLFDTRADRHLGHPASVPTSLASG